MGGRLTFIDNMRVIILAALFALLQCISAFRLPKDFGKPPPLKIKCENEIDLAVLVQVATPREYNFPIKDIESKFFNPCIRTSVVLVTDKIKVLKKLNCLKRAYCGWNLASKWRQGLKNLPKGIESESKAQLAEALSNVYDLVFAQGGRPGAKKVVIVVTSTAPTDVSLKNAASDFLEEQGTLVAVGVGEGKEENLKVITQSTDRNIKLDNLEDLSLEDKINLIKSKFDPNVKRLSVQHGVQFSDFAVAEALETDFIDAVAEEDKCKHIIDIAFLVDSSGSIKLDYDKELLFVQRIANRFGISETGTHAGVVIFSDEPIGEFIKMTIKMNDFFDTKSFNNEVKKSPYFGWRTRIDLGFNVVENELFNVANGHRPNVKKVLFLITDGKQNPKKDRKTGEVFDPVAASQIMVDNGVQIFGVGIGTNLDTNQLNNITRDASKVYYAETIDKLISDDFVNEVSKKTCDKSGELKPDNKTTDCNKTDGCCCCCGSKVYINIFQSGSGPNYVLQGATVSQSGNHGPVTAMGTPDGGTRVDVTDGMSKSKLMELLENAIPDNKALVRTLKGIIDEHMPDAGPSRAKNVPEGRKRRSLDSQTESLPKFPGILKVAKLSGCGKFIQALEKHGITAEMDKYVNQHKTVTLFCPLDSALEGIDLYPSDRFEKMKIRELLRHHVAVKHDSHGTMYRSMLNETHVALHPRHINRNKVSWMVEESHIKFSLYDGNYGEVVIIDDVLTPPLVEMMQVIKYHPKLTHMYSLLTKVGGLSDLLKSNNIEKVCFKQNLCVKMAEDMKLRMQQALKFSQSTLMAPSDDVFEKMDKWDLLKIKSIPEKRKEFLRQHIYLGILNKDLLTSEMNLLAQPVDEKDSIAVLHDNNKNTMATMPDDKTYKLTDSIRVKEGMVIVQDIV